MRESLPDRIDIITVESRSWKIAILCLYQILIDSSKRQLAVQGRSSILIITENKL